MWINPKYADRYPAPASPAPPQDDGEPLGTFRRGDREELRVVLKEFKGHPYISLRLWERDQGGAWWPTKGKGLSIRISEAQGVAEALASVGGSNPAERGAERRESERNLRPSGPPRGHRN